MQGVTMDVDLYVLLTQRHDVMLGIQWLQNLGKVTHDYGQQTMKLTLLNTTYSLKGDDALRMKKIRLHQMQALLGQDEIYMVYEVHSLPLEAVAAETQAEGAALERTELATLLGSRGGGDGSQESEIRTRVARAYESASGTRVFGTRRGVTFDNLTAAVVQHPPFLRLPDFNPMFRGLKLTTWYNGIGVADALSQMYDDEDADRAAFMALSRQVVGIMTELKEENESLVEFLSLHLQLDMGTAPMGFRREQGLVIF
ncbi:hypothetical protein Tco_1376623 [Tanacetum coccineum]